MKSIIFFNHRGGAGKTTMVYHVAWMLSEIGVRTIAVDLDPQAYLTSMCLSEERMRAIDECELPVTVFDSISPVMSGDMYRTVHIEPVSHNLGLVLGSLSLSIFEDKLSDAWLRTLDGDSHSFRLTRIFNTVVNDAVSQFDAEVVLIDVGANVGSINRAVTISADYIIMPVASDLFSLQAVKSFGQTLMQWKRDWAKRQKLLPPGVSFEIPTQLAHPAGYIVVQHHAKEGTPLASCPQWTSEMPSYFAKYVLARGTDAYSVQHDPFCIALVKHDRSLARMAIEAQKPFFLLTSSDGAEGVHAYAVQKSHEEYRAIVQGIMNRCD